MLIILIKYYANNIKNVIILIKVIFKNMNKIWVSLSFIPISLFENGCQLKNGDEGWLNLNAVVKRIKWMKLYAINNGWLTPLLSAFLLSAAVKIILSQVMLALGSLRSEEPISHLQRYNGPWISESPPENKFDRKMGYENW